MKTKTFCKTGCSWLKKFAAEAFIDDYHTDATGYISGTLVCYAASSDVAWDVFFTAIHNY